MTPISRETLAKMTLQEKYDAIDTIDVRYPRASYLQKIMADCHSFFFRKCPPEPLVIYGSRGVGKTWAVNRYVNDHLKIREVETDEGTIITRNILVCEIYEGATKSRVVEIMLEALGDPNPTAGKNGQKEHRLTKLLKECKVELIIMDEVQHLILRKRKELVIVSVADWLKSIVNTTGIPMILVGQIDAQELMGHNQLEDRSVAPFHMYGFRKTHLDEFTKILALIDEQLPFPKLSNLDKGQSVKGLFEICDGSFRKLMQVIRRAARLALERNAEKIELRDLSEAWKMYRGKKDDPFVTSKRSASA